MIASTTALRRFDSRPLSRPELIRALAPNHPAILHGHSIFRSKVVDADKAPRLFVSGLNNRKIGKQVQKGEWAGMPIYMLTLEERATCPTSCSTWGTCYGNAMHMARRHRHGPALEARIQTEITQLSREHPNGFVIRLHVLGDFYSVAYVDIWSGLLARYKELHVFGYTARDGCEIGGAVQEMNARFQDRCFIRTSSKVPRPGGASVVMVPTPIDGAIICPAELSKTACCSTCGLCWSPAAREKAILFILHGNPFRGRSKTFKQVEIMSEGGWQELSPWNLKVSDEPRATIRAAMIGKHKAPTIFIGVNGALTKLLQWDVGGRALARVELGIGANAGKMRIFQSEKGRFRMAVSGKKGVNNGVRLIMRLPNQPASTSRPQIVDHKIDGKSLTISIPQVWADVVQVVPYSPASTPITAKPIDKMHSARHPITDDIVQVAVKPDVLQMIEREEKKNTPAQVQETANAQQLPSEKLAIIGRYLMVGTTPISLFADEISFAKAMLDKFGQTLNKFDAEKIDRKPEIPILRLKSRLVGMKIIIEDRRNGWAFANAVAA